MQNSKHPHIDLLRILGLLALLAGIAYFYANLFFPRSVPYFLRPLVLDRPTYILVLGTDITIDKETHKKTFEFGRTDSILAIYLDPIKEKLSFLSVPRDTYLEIPGIGKKKVNAAYVYGRIELTKETVEKFTGLKFDKYIIVNTQGFKKLVDLLGGVRIYVEKDMYYVDRAQNLHIDLKQGWQKLSGKQAEGYVRFRHDDLYDIGRVERQKKFLTVLSRSLATPQALLKAPFIIEIVKQNLLTDLTLKEFILLTNTVRSMDLSRLKSFTVPGKMARNQAGDIWESDPEELKEIIRKDF